jgi:hypothetical protein
VSDQQSAACQGPAAALTYQFVCDTTRG